jgi:hypothetical protein
MHARDIIEKFGGQSALAKLLGKPQSTVSYWVKSGTIPARWQGKLLKLAGENGVALSAHDFMAKPVPAPEPERELFAKYKGELTLGQSTVDCYVLSDGSRVISMRSAVLAIAKVESGNLGEYIGVEALKSFIDKDKVLGETLTFSIPGTQFKGVGLPAEVFLEVCQGYVTAFTANALKTDRQKENAMLCAVLLASCAKVGLIALIDEATGYQFEREDDALRVKLKAFIADELRSWEKTFPDELWEEFGRLTGWKGALHSRPKWWGKLVIELIYETLDPDVAAYLRTNKPPAGIHWHRQLTENYGARQLVSRCFEVVGMAKDCTTINELRSKVALHYGKEPVQITLFLPARPN